QINLRGNPEDRAFLAGVKSAIGLELPTTPNKVASSGASKALWLAPEEWLIVSEAGDDLITKLEAALAGQHVAVNDLSANRIIFELSGSHSHDVLMKSCELDLHPRAFKPGDCAQTLIAKSQAIVEQTGETVFHIYVRCSFSRYVGAWLTDAQEEYISAR
ncbi:MAG: hypothetical protein K9G33_15410, partial [Sneathiella sp.]|nr:hypothetical protein [Sneathiella sp.]